MQSSNKIPFERWRLYLPRNLPHCSEYEEELKKHIQKKTKLLDDYLKENYPNILSAILPRADSGLGLDDEDGENDFTNTENFLDSEGPRRKSADVSSTIFRKSSLQRRNSSASSKNGRKVVRFADSLGLELEQIRLILCSDLPPYISPSKSTAAIKNSTKFLAANFNLDFLSNRRQNSDLVFLNSFNIYDDCLMGDVKVRNLNFEKFVFLRFTFNEWISFEDFPCKYVASSSRTLDTFSFCLFVPLEKFRLKRKFYFAVAFKCDGNFYWDNNDGKNYSLECYERPNSPWDRLWFQPRKSTLCKQIERCKVCEVKFI